jgi:hypothetical protein
MKYRTSILTVILSWLTFFLFSFSISKSQKQQPEPQKYLGHYDVIIVPGVPYKDNRLAMVFKARMLWAKYLYDNHIAENIIFSGGAVYSPYVEGRIMKIFADSMHIPSANTFAETQAEHSTENIYYSMLMARELGFNTIAVATDRYQALLVRKFIDKNCPDIKLVLIDYKKIDIALSPWPEINPVSARVHHFVSLAERENPLKRFMGTLGKNINYDENDSSNLQQKKSLFQLVDITKFH